MPLEGWDHVELWVGNAKQAASATAPPTCSTKGTSGSS